MKIALRTSGGRGEYELAGSQGSVSSAELKGIPISYEFTPDLIIPGYSTVQTGQGKPRLRLRTPRSDLHLALLLADVLLLPLPKRELSKTGSGLFQLKRHAFGITEVKVDIAEQSASKVVLRPTDILLANAAHNQMLISFANRMARVLITWDAASKGADRLHVLVLQHQASVTASSVDHKTIHSSAEALRKLLKTSDDVLPLVERSLGIDPDAEREEDVDEITPEAFPEQDDTTPVEAKRRQISQWRKQAIRGSKGQKFRKAVRAAYSNTCLFSGMHLPKLESLSSAGVDAAHILPWASFEIESVSNGICLSKICHWAFDAGILRVTFDKTKKKYLLDIPPEVSLSAQAAGFSLKYFEDLVGEIPESRLPPKRSDWPKPSFISQLNDSVP